MSSGLNNKVRFARLGVALAVIAPLAQANAQTIISELLYDAAGTDSGKVFVELYGTPGTLMDGLFLDGINGSDGSVYQTVTLTGVIGSDGVFVIGDDDGNGGTLVSNADLVADVDFQNGPDSIVLRDASGVLDALGYGDFSSAVFAGEGSAAVDVTGGWSLARATLLDTDDNAVDFIGLDAPTPGSVPVGTVPVPPALALFLSGIVGLAGVSRRRG